jgi:hypothetical protein
METTHEMPNSVGKAAHCLITAGILTVALTLAFCGCGTTTQRTGIEQLLLSDAVDMAVEQLDMSVFNGKQVFLDTSYLPQPHKDRPETVGTNYLASSIRQRLASSGALLTPNREDAEIIVEPRVGALGANGHEVVYGIPRNNALGVATSVLPNVPTIPVIPEIALARVDSNSGIAKVMLFAYDRETRLPVWQSGIARAESTSRNTWVFGAGPVQNGTVYKGTRFAGGVMLKDNFAIQDKAPGIPYGEQFVFESQAKATERTANSESEATPLTPIQTK